MACASVGEGSPLVMPPGWLCHLDENRVHPAAASVRESLEVIVLERQQHFSDRVRGEDLHP